MRGTLGAGSEDELTSFWLAVPAGFKFRSSSSPASTRLRSQLGFLNPSCFISNINFRFLFCFCLVCYFFFHYLWKDRKGSWKVETLIISFIMTGRYSRKLLRKRRRRRLRRYKRSRRRNLRRIRRYFRGKRRARRRKRRRRRRRNRRKRRPKRKWFYSVLYFWPIASAKNVTKLAHCAKKIHKKTNETRQNKKTNNHRGSIFFTAEVT